jgi:hypothetical protein
MSGAMDFVNNNKILFLSHGFILLETQVLQFSAKIIRFQPSVVEEVQGVRKQL